MTGAPIRRGPIDCPHCGKTVESDQDWCLHCGAPARTRLLKAPDWRRPVAVLAALVAVSLLAFGLSFVDLTKDPEPPSVKPVNTIKTVTAPPPTTPVAP